MNKVQLNTVNLGGDIVIKKSEGGSESGGGNLSPDAIVYEPNGWYWKWIEGVPSNFKASAGILYGLQYDYGAKYYNGILTNTTNPNGGSIIVNQLSLGMAVARMLDSTDNTGACIIAVSESKYCSVTSGGTTYVGDSIYDIVSQLQPMTEAEFIGAMESEMGITRITKEEYESLLTTE